MRSIVAILLLGLIATAVARPVLTRSEIKRVGDVASVSSPKVDWCGVCVNFLNNAINQIINIILNIGVEGGCDAVCELLSTPTEQAICQVLCDIEGIQGFMNLINEANPDPIYYCMSLGQCPIHDQAAGKITKLSVTPGVVKQNDQFTVLLTFQITSTAGVGEVAVDVFPPESSGGFPFGDGQIFETLQPGNYNAHFTFSTEPGQDEPFTAGTYQVVAAVCQGSCGGGHPHEFTLSQSQTTFKLTQ